jgi:hypothetical protein
VPDKGENMGNHRAVDPEETGLPVPSGTTVEKDDEGRITEMSGDL